MSFPRYERYKDSGVEWLGEVPEHWDLIPLKRLATFVNGDAFKPSEWAESGTPIIRIQNLNGSEKFNYFEGEVEQRYLVHNGDLLFGWSGNRGTSFGPFLWNHDEVCALNQHIFRVVPESLEKRQLYWILKAVTAHVEDQAHGIIGMVHVTKGELGSINVPVPPRGEERLLTAFLENEMGKLDALIVEQRRLIELLKEKHEALISHSVTKGLNPSASITDAGVEWLGDIPEHWTTVRLRRILSEHLINGIFKKKEEFGEGTLLVNVFDIYQRDFRVNFEQLERVKCDEREIAAYKVLPGDLLFVRSSLKPDGIAAVALATEWHEDAVFECHLIRARPNLKVLRPRFASYLLNSMIYRSKTLSLAKITTMTTLDQEAILSIVLPLPPILEQDAIADFLDSESARFQKLVVEAASAISLLEERRSALISAAVTGKIDVRNYEPTEATELEEAYEPA